MRQFLLECLVDLPDDVFDQVDVVAAMKAPWAHLMKDLQSREINFRHKAQLIESQDVVATMASAKRGRKPKGQQQPAVTKGAKRGRKPKANLAQPTIPTMPPWEVTEVTAAD